jgi:acyl carrier protein
MTTSSLDIVRDAIDSVAPELDVASIPDSARLQEDVGLDSLDFLNVIAAVHRSTGVDVPESEYAKVATVGGFASYLDARSAETC